MSRWHVSIDLETLSSEVDAAILSIGAVAFDSTGSLVEWSQNINLNSCLLAGLRVDDGAFRFWLSQPDEARTSVCEPSPIPLRRALHQLAKWEPWESKPLVWSHATFDLPILGNAYRALGMGVPWRYRNARDLRTLIDLAYGEEKIPEIPQNGRHQALADAARQAVIVQRCLARLQAVEVPA